MHPLKPVIGLCLLFSLSGIHAALGQPNVLFISIDDLNDWVGVLGGHPQAKTPNIDRLAERGMLFTNAHAVSTSCIPSRAALLFGVSPATSGIYHQWTDWRRAEYFNDLPSLPRHFRDNGYRTAGGGKIFHAGSYSPSLMRGQQDVTAWDAYYPDLNWVMPTEITPFSRPANNNPGYIAFDWSSIVAEDFAMADGQVVNWATEELTKDSDQPEFIAVGLWRPHIPWYTPEKYFEMYPLESIELPATLENDLDDVPPLGHKAEMRGLEMHEWVVEHGVWEEAVQAYLASIAYADAMVGKIIDALDASGRADETVIVLWSDHGVHLGEKGRWRKMALWEEDTHVPLIIVAPNVGTPGTRSAKPVSLLDIYPTLVDLVGLRDLPHLEGRSLLPLLEDPEAGWNHAAVSVYGFGNYAVRDERYRYIRYVDGTEELYDHQTDPHEWHNLAGDITKNDVKRQLAARIPKKQAEDFRTSSPQWPTRLWRR